MHPDRIFALRGEWNFYKWEDGRYLDPVTVQVPGYWNDLVVGGKRLGAKAIGRYELKILTRMHPPPTNLGPRPISASVTRPRQDRPRMGPLTLLVPSPFGSAYSVQTQDLRTLSEDGVIDYQKETSRAGYSHNSNPFPFAAKSGDTLSIYINMANHHHHLGGLVSPPLFGLQPAIERFEFWWNLPVIFVGSLLLGFSIFSLGLYMIFRSRRLLLYASLFSMIGLVRLLFSDAMPIRFLSSSLPWNLIMSIRFLTMPYMAFFTGLYVLEFFSHKRTAYIRRFLYWGVGLISFLVILLPPFPKSYVIYLTQIYLLSTIGVILWLLIREGRPAKRDIQIIFFTAALTAAFVIAQVYNFYSSYSIRSTQTYGLLVVTTGMTLLVLRDVMRLNGERSQLTFDLRSANQGLSELTKSLENKVVERTQELAERNQELETLQRFKQRTNAMIVHDLKNPLQVILSQSSAKDAPNRRIHSAGRRMLLMIKNLLDVDRAERAQLIVRPEQLLLAELEQDAIERQRSFLEEKKIQIEFIISSTVKIISDRILTERAADNILHNAIKYTPVGGKIRLHTKYENDFVALYCDDSGPGVPEDLRGQIFTEYTTDGAQSDAHGLGLSFVHTAMKAVSGRVEVATPTSGLGGRFVLYFPSVVAPSPSQPNLSDIELKYLLPHLSNLRDTPHYSATTVEAILDKIPDVGGIPYLKQAVREAMYAGDEKAYVNLLK